MMAFKSHSRASAHNTSRRFARSRFSIHCALLAAVLVACDTPTIQPPPDLVLHDAQILTMDPAHRFAEAVWLSQGEIRAVGSDADIFARAPREAKRVDLEGRTVVPGFNDNHTHAFGAGRLFDQPVLRRKTCTEIEAIIAAEATRKPEGEVIEGAHWDYSSCPDPHRDMLDRAAPDHPVSLIQFSGHASWVNSRMLEEMGIDRDTEDPEGGQIVRDPSGEPTGVLRDTAMPSAGSAVMRSLLVPSEHRRHLRVALDLFRRAGITSVQDNTWQPLSVWHLANFRDEGTLTARFSLWPMGDELDLTRRLMSLAGGSYDGAWLRLGPAKHFADGAFSTRTAWLLGESYADEPGNNGAPRHDQEAIDAIVLEAAEDGRQIAVHVIGDAAASQVLNALERASEHVPDIASLRMRLEHVQLVAPGDLERMRSLGVVANIHPFALTSPTKDERLLGAERARRAYPYRSLIEAGVPVSCGSDIPAEVDYHPMLGIYYLVTRQNVEGTAGPLNSDEQLTPEQALHCYTMGSAYAEFAEGRKGSITPGKWADLAVLDANPITSYPERIKDIQVEMTIVGGRVVYDSRD
jgi:hypothetical protein